MSDQTTSGAQPEAAAATPGDAAPAAAPVLQTAPGGSPADLSPVTAGNEEVSAHAETPARLGAFGTARGSGLSRGKRPVTASVTPVASAPAPAGYQPTAVEVITPVREYQNPFASETPAAAPVNEPAPGPAAPSAPSTASAHPADAGTAAVREASTLDGEPEVAPAPSPSAVAPAGEGPAEIKILPPASTPRPTVSWGGTSHDEETHPHRETRQTFRPESREPRNFEPRKPRHEQRLEQRGPLPPEPRIETAGKSGGFLGWLKGIFGGKPEAEPDQAQRQGGQDHDGGPHHRRRRRRRGGRGRGGHHGDNRGPREAQSQTGGQSGFSGEGERRFEGGGHRRRRRGGRGRHRDHRGGPHSEGQQSGGAI